MDFHHLESKTHIISQDKYFKTKVCYNGVSLMNKFQTKNILRRWRVKAAPCEYSVRVILESFNLYHRYFPKVSS